MDKALALRGGGELVALWAQLFSVIDMVSAVALAGVGAGLAVLVAQAGPAERQALLLSRAMRLGLAVCLPVALCAAVAGYLFSGVLSPAVLALAALCGWIAVGPGLINCYWQGQQRRGRMLALAVSVNALTLAAAALAPRTWTLEALALSQALPVLVLLAMPRPGGAAPRAEDRALERYLLPGIAIGVLGPTSMLVARGFVADALSWHEAGVLQALWRIADWVWGIAGGVLSVLYLPRFAAAYPGADFGRAIRSAVWYVLIPSALLFGALLAVHRPLLALLYDASFEVSATAAALIFAGSAVRIASWIPLFALYAMHRTRAIAIGELLSLPLFAVMVGAAGERLTLELAGVFWLAAYGAYAAFNVWALRRR